MTNFFSFLLSMAQRGSANSISCGSICGRFVVPVDQRVWVPKQDGGFPVVRPTAAGAVGGCGASSLEFSWAANSCQENTVDAQAGGPARGTALGCPSVWVGARFDTRVSVWVSAWVSMVSPLLPSPSPHPTPALLTVQCRNRVPRNGGCFSALPKRLDEARSTRPSRLGEAHAAGFTDASGLRE